MTKITKQATALKYDTSNNDKPTIVAKGNDVIADEIIALAEEHGVLVHENPQLAEVLDTLEIGESIPPEIFIIVAELIAFSFVLQGKFPENWEGTRPINTKA